MDEETLTRQAKQYRELHARAETARLRLAESIRAAAAAGVRQVAIVKATGYTREQVRLIVAGRTR